MPSHEYRVLIVEDHPVQQLMLKQMPIWSPHTRFVLAGRAFDAAEALELLAQSVFDVVITDIVLPGMDGLNLLKLIRTRYPGVRVLLMSSLQTFEYAHGAIIHGASDYLVKPLSTERVLRALQRIDALISGRDEDPDRDSVCLDLAVRICSLIEAGEAPSSGELRRYLDVALGRPCLRTLPEGEVMVRGIRLLLELLFWKYSRLNMRPAAELLMLNTGLTDSFERFSAAVDLIGEAFRLLTLPHVTQELSRNTIRLVLQDPTGQMTVTSAAAALFVNRTYLSHAFKQQCGISLSHYLTQVKMYRAQILLLDNGRLVLEVARACGYQDEEHFSKVFKKSVGMTPRDYQKQLFSRKATQ